MGAHSQNQKRFRRSWNMRPHLFLLPLASLVSPLLCQLKFSGGVSASSSNSNSNSPNRNTNNRPTDVDEKFFLGGDTPSLTGNQALDGGIVGTTTAAIFRGPTDSKTIPGRTGRAAIKADQELCGAVVFKQ